MDCAWRRVACEKDTCPICGHINKDRKRHIDVGEDPDDIDMIFEDVGRTFKETLELIKKDAESKGFDITNIDDIKEPPRPEKFGLYRKLAEWHKELTKFLAIAEKSESMWLYTPEGQDLSWYKNILLAKVYRQLCNRWELDNGAEYGKEDFEYTKYVLDECFKILESAFSELIQIDSPQKSGLLVLLGGLQKIKAVVEKI